MQKNVGKICIEKYKNKRFLIIYRNLNSFVYLLISFRLLLYKINVEFSIFYEVLKYFSSPEEKSAMLDTMEHQNERTTKFGFCIVSF